MIANYSDNPDLLDRCLNLMDESFPGCKKYALKGIKYGAFWDKSSTPFIIEQDGELIAHAGVWPIKLMLNGQEHTTGCFHGICVKKLFRGKGYFKQLMQEIIQYVQQFDSSIMFVTKPYLYKNYPYRIMLPEYDFAINDAQLFKDRIQSSTSDLRTLRLDNQNDLNLLHQILAKRVLLSKHLSAMNPELFILNIRDKQIFYTEKLNTLIVYEIAKNFLYIQEIISTQQQNISDIISAIIGYEKKDFTEIVLQFYPDRFLKQKEYSPILARTRYGILASKDFIFKDSYFRYPELYEC